MNVILLSPGYPADMPEFTRGLAEVGANVIGIGDQPAGALPETARRHLAAYVQVRSLFDELATVHEVRDALAGHRIDRVESNWEPLMVLAARLREALGATGLTVEQTLPFRDKEAMKRRLDAAGIRTPRHESSTTIAGCWAAAERIGFPLIVKPIAGAGSADTYRCDSADDLREVLPLLRHVREVSVEEFVDGEEFTFDTITIGGEVKYWNVAWYRPRPLVARTNEWISPQVVALRRPDQPELAGGVQMGFEVIRALGFETGFTHMEWYRKADGEVVFGEIGARPPGARTVDLMNFASDVDLFAGWAEAELHGTFSLAVERKYNAACITKRAHGQGRIQRIEGLDRIRARCGDAICAIDLLPVGAHRRDWKATLLSDGYVTLRHPDWQTTKDLADFVGTDLHLYAG